MSPLLFYQFLSREISSVWIIETEYIHWFSFFFYFLALEEKPITFFIFSGKYNNNIREGKNKTYMKAEITVVVSSLVFALWSSRKSLTLRGLKHLVYETKTFKSSYFESHDIPTEHFRDSRVTGFLFYFYI